MYTFFFRSTPELRSVLVVLYLCICIMYFIAFLYRLVYFMLSHERFSIFIHF